MFLPYLVKSRSNGQGQGYGGIPCQPNQAAALLVFIVFTLMHRSNVACFICWPVRRQMSHVWQWLENNDIAQLYTCCWLRRCYNGHTARLVQRQLGANNDVSYWRHQMMTSAIDVIDKYVTPVWYVVGVPGNLLAFIVWTQRKMRASSGCYLAALALNDCIFLLLQVCSQYVNRRRWLKI